MFVHIIKDLRMSVLNLPSEILLKIFSYLDTSTIASSVQRTCKLWYEVGKDPSLWKSLSFRGGRSVCFVCKVLPFYPRLRNLKIERGVLNSSLFKAISELNHLESLQLIECTFFIGSMASFHYLIQSSSLSVLELKRCCFDDKIIKIISEAKCLKSFIVTNLDNPSLIEILDKCKELEELKIDKNDNLRDGTICHIFSSLSKTITSLHLNGDKHLTDSALNGIEECSFLSRLSLSRCCNVTDLSLARFHRLSKLQYLSLGFATSLTSSELKRFFETGPVAELIHLDLTRCSNFDDSCLVTVVDRCKFLKTLCLNNCLKLTDISIRQVVHESSFLTNLDLSWNQTLKGIFLPDLKNHLKNLQVLDLRMCRGIEKALINSLMSFRHLLQIYQS